MRRKTIGSDCDRWNRLRGWRESYRLADGASLWQRLCRVSTERVGAGGIRMHTGGGKRGTEGSCCGVEAAALEKRRRRRHRSQERGAWRVCCCDSGGERRWSVRRWCGRPVEREVLAAGERAVVKRPLGGDPPLQQSREEPGPADLVEAARRRGEVGKGGGGSAVCSAILPTGRGNAVIAAVSVVPAMKYVEKPRAGRRAVIRAATSGKARLCPLHICMPCCQSHGSAQRRD
mmetsp:Transcript_19019/g.56345  ORF Transcript_19019/g.56345 Transcript_19019/m.56345 type:complete len:232 (-) Transcript_19019:1595-2290(-)